MIKLEQYRITEWNDQKVVMAKGDNQIIFYKCDYDFEIKNPLLRDEYTLEFESADKVDFGPSSYHTSGGWQKIKLDGQSFEEGWNCHHFKIDNMLNNSKAVKLKLKGYDLFQEIQDIIINRELGLKLIKNV